MGGLILRRVVLVFCPSRFDFHLQAFCQRYAYDECFGFAPFFIEGGCRDECIVGVWNSDKGSELIAFPVFAYGEITISPRNC